MKDFTRCMCYLWHTCTVHHEQWATCWWMRGELQVMNLCSVSEEVIHMTSRAIRGLVPNLSGDNRCISSSHLHPFSFLPPSWETTHQKHGHLGVWSWTRSQPNCTYVCMLSVFFFFFGLPARTPQRQKETRSHLSSLRSHPSDLDPTLEDRCSPMVHALILDGSKVPLLWLREPEEWSDSLDIQ